MDYNFDKRCRLKDAVHSIWIRSDRKSLLKPFNIIASNQFRFSAYTRSRSKNSRQWVGWLLQSENHCYVVAEKQLTPIKYFRMLQHRTIRLTLYLQQVTNFVTVTSVCRERSGSVVKCWTRNRGAAGSSLTRVTALWSLSKTHLS